MRTYQEYVRLTMTTVFILKVYFFYLVMGLTLASTTDRPLQHLILSGNSWIPAEQRLDSHVF